ncbi:NAD(P)-dependent oxidoreductase [Leucobacter sp. USHLN153]|uniref:NAD(P)-dependent oxidoreductase n=1 Tax=Leucobacter sp. USHLN153 TaxID=3081268 RepID=UPI003016A592
MKILVIGLGTMGTPIARRLAGAGFALTLNDVNAEAANALAAELGAEAVADLADNTGPFDVVLLMLPNSNIVAAVLDQVLTSPGAIVKAGSVVLDMGSSQPWATQENATRLARLGVALVDAPVSGGPVRAASGELSIMVGADYNVAFDRVQPALKALGTTITRAGGVGSGHAVKALNNLLSLIGIVGAVEVLAVGEQFGLDPRVMLDVLNASTGRNHATEVKIGPQVVDAGWNVGFSLGLTVKDVDTALELARRQKQDLELGERAGGIAHAALAALDFSADQSEIAKYLEDRLHAQLSRVTSTQQH